MRGSSPWTLTTISPSSKPKARAASAIRSVPEGCSARVITNLCPAACTAAAIRGSSVATWTEAAPLCIARSYTRTTMGLPAISASGFPGNRLDA
jgi:hypothetical protein